MRALYSLTIVVLSVFTFGCGPGRVPQPTPAPDIGKRAVGTEGMVTSAHPQASEAGLELLRAGGNAIDAAVAAAFAVGVVEPMMAGIGGSGGMLIWEAEKGEADYLDFYAIAPEGVSPEFDRSVHPARIVAVPGAVAGLLEAHSKYGRLPREAVLAPAIRLAEEGFPVGSLLARTIAGDSVKLSRDPDAARIFWPDGRPLQPGERLVQPELGATLRQIAEEGRDGFYRGPVAEEIIEVLSAGGNPMTLTDLEGFEPSWRRPLCAPYRGWTVLTAPPPQSGMQVAQALRLLEDYDLPALGLPTESVPAFHSLSGALRVATADRQAYLHDPDHHPVPANGLVSAEYAEERGPLVGGEEGPPTRIRAGDPWAADQSPTAGVCESFDPYPPAGAGVEVARHQSHLFEGGDDEVEDGETTHLSVIDRDGNAVSLTYTQGVYFGSGLWAAGTFLNSSMNIFSSNPESPKALLPGRKPTSTTTPTIILEGAGVRLVVGSPGAARIPTAVTQAIIYILDYGLDPLEALRMPRIHPQASHSRVPYEQGFRTDLIGAVRELGYQPEVMPPASLYFGGIHLIERRGKWLIGAADPRRDGEARGF